MWFHLQTWLTLWQKQLQTLSSDWGSAFGSWTETSHQSSLHRRQLTVHWWQTPVWFLVLRFVPCFSRSSPSAHQQTCSATHEIDCPSCTCSEETVLLNNSSCTWSVSHSVPRHWDLSHLGATHTLEDAYGCQSSKYSHFVRRYGC